MKNLALAIALLASSAAAVDPEMVCIGCAFLSSLAQEGAPVPWAKISQSCHGERRCEEAVTKLSQTSAKSGAGENPDEVCVGLGLCDGSCQLYDPTFGPEWPPVAFPPAPPAWPVQSATLDDESGPAKHLFDIFEDMARAVTINPRKLGGDVECNRTDIYCDVMRFGDYHYPLVDKDGDEFNDWGQGTMRGYHWRGKDCDTSNGDIYPGRKTTSEGADVDHDCNGIFGSDEDGLSYEDKFCADSGRRGIVILGDSATAHFHVPPAWLTADGWDESIVMSNASLVLAEDELDVPYCSWGTAHVGGEQCPYAFNFTINSLYKKLSERNRCNHRDFQNIGVNGARVTSSMSLVESLARDPTNDNPLLLVFSLMGNDVCNGHPGSDHMTTTDEFYSSAMESLTALDAKLPKGSYVMSVGLVDGRVLWDSLSENQHPVGSSYPQMYEFLSCNEANPCWGWLNANETWRNFTSERAANLTQVWVDIRETETFENFTLINFWPDMRTLINDYVKIYGGKPSDVIEPSDGFHPSQLGNTLLAETMWDWLLVNYPDAVGEINPHNAEIDALFGDQGGY